MSTTRSGGRAPATGRPARAGAGRRPGRGVKVLGVVLALALVGGWLYLMYGSPVFAAKRVEVTGTDRLTEAQVMQAAAVPMGTPLARVDVDAVESRVLGLAQVQTAQVSRGWPNTVRVDVHERVPVATVQRNGAWWLLDDEAVVVATEAKRPRLPMLTVANPEPKDASTRSALAVVETLPKSLSRDVLSVSADSPDEVKLHLRRSVVVVWGNAEDAARKARVLKALRQTRPKASEYDVSTPETATVRD